MIIVESHHEVLEHWARYRASLPKAPRLFTLDHHTDTSAPFRSFLKQFPQSEAILLRQTLLQQIDFKKPETVKKAQDNLDHDEHIVTAIKSDIISSALVIAQNAYDTSLDVYKEHKIMCLGVDRKANSQALLQEEYDQVLESQFLTPLMDLFTAQLQELGECGIFQEPFILDIDLDYLNTSKAAQPQNTEALGRLVRGAGLITIAIERNHVLMCSQEPGLSSDFLLKSVQNLIGEYL